MSLIAYTLLMFGCADDGSACERIAYDAPRYEAKTQCQTQVEAALGSDVALKADYPLVEARCVPLKVARAQPARGQTVSARLR